MQNSEMATRYEPIRPFINFKCLVFSPLPPRPCIFAFSPSRYSNPQPYIHETNTLPLHHCHSPFVFSIRLYLISQLGDTTEVVIIFTPDDSSSPTSWSWIGSPVSVTSEWKGFNVVSNRISEGNFTSIVKVSVTRLFAQFLSIRNKENLPNCNEKFQNGFNIARNAKQILENGIFGQI